MAKLFRRVSTYVCTFRLAALHFHSCCRRVNNSMDLFFRVSTVRRYSRSNLHLLKCSSEFSALWNLTTHLHHRFSTKPKDMCTGWHIALECTPPAKIPVSSRLIIDTFFIHKIPESIFSSLLSDTSSYLGDLHARVSF